MNIIDREELKQKLDRGDEFKLVMTMGDLAFQASHIPGSISISTREDFARLLDKGDEIVVYCSDRACVASKFTYKALIANGYTNVRRYSGGLSDWEQAGYPLEQDPLFAAG